MFKKTLIFSLAICMLSVNVFAGTSMLSLVQDVSAASTPTKTETATVKPEAVYVSHTLNAEKNAITAQNLEYYAAEDPPSGDKNTNVGGKIEREGWVYVKLPLSGFSAISAASLEAKLKWNNGGTIFYLKKLNESVWNTAVSGLTSEGNKTFEGDAMLSAPSNTDVLCTQVKPADVDTSTSNKYAMCTLTSDALTEYVNSSVNSEYAYFVLYGQLADKDGGAIILDTLKFTVTGSVPLEGLSAGLMKEKTATLSFGNGDIGYVTADDSEFVSGTTADIDESKINNYSDTVYTYKMQTTTDKANDNAVLYFKKDISEYLGKEISKVELKAKYRANSTANKMEISRTAGWVADGEGEINLENQPVVDESANAVECTFADNQAHEASYDITSLVRNIPADYNGVLSLRIRGILGSGKTGYAVQLQDFNKVKPCLIITYKDEIAGNETTGTNFTFSTTAEAGESIRLLVAVYGEGGTFLGALIKESAVISDGETPIEMDVDLSAYPTAVSVKAYMWNGTTLMPYILPIERNVA